MTVNSISTTPVARPLVSSSRASGSDDFHAEAAYPAEKFSGSSAVPGTVSLVKPLELTPLAYKLPKPVDRIDSIKEVLTVQDAWDMGITGKGVTVAVVDTGIYPHPDLGNRLIEFKDYVNGKNGVENAYDDNGHGSHCAGLVGGDGKMAGGRFKGPAYEANLVGVKVLDGAGSGNMSNVVKGVMWCIANKDRLGIKVISMSLGAPSNLKEKDDVVAQAVDAALKAGIVPVIAAGNSGPFVHTIGSPAISPGVLTVGAYDDKNTASHADDTMAFFSSRGPTTRDHLEKPDVSAPGVNMVSFRSPHSEIDNANVSKLGDYYLLLSGTSMATPVTAGVAALVCQANPNLTPDQVIQIMKDTAEPIANAGVNLGGHGLVDPGKAVKKALEMKKQAEEAAQHKTA